LELGARVPSLKEALLRPIGRCQTFNATADGYVRTGDAADLRVDLSGRLISEWFLFKGVWKWGPPSAPGYFIGKLLIYLGVPYFLTSPYIKPAGQYVLVAFSKLAIYDVNIFFRTPPYYWGCLTDSGFGWTDMFIVYTFIIKHLVAKLWVGRRWIDQSTLTLSKPNWLWLPVLVLLCKVSYTQQWYIT
jgi:hypothetical protein